jgi:hypothetical protein
VATFHTQRHAQAMLAAQWRGVSARKRWRTYCRSAVCSQRMVRGWLARRR